MEAAGTGTPPAEEKLAVTIPRDDTTPSTSDISRIQESHKPISSPPRRSGIPPKRLSGVAQRPNVSTPNSTTKSSTASPSRGATAGGLSKPPTRPIANASGRRPISSVNASTAVSSTHRARPSTNSVEEDKKSAAGLDGENKRPSGPSSAKRVSIASVQSNKPTSLKATPSSADRRNSTMTSTTVDKKTPPSRTGATSPTKGILRTASSSTKSIGDSNTPRALRPPPGSSRAATRPTVSDSHRKRLSTIPASPTPISSDPVPPVFETPVEDLSSKPARPGLVTRKSTMSITIEQRLREMELVNEMLQAAMAEDGDEEDEVKEEYGRKVDEQLASLRIKLQEARRNEGKEDIKPPETVSNPGDKSGSAHAPPLQDDVQHENPGTLNSALSDSQQKVSRLEAEMAAMNTKMLDLNIAAENAAKEIQLTTENLHAQHTAKIEELSVTHKAELEVIRSKLAQAETQKTRFDEESTKDLEDAKRTTIDEKSADMMALLEDEKKSYRDTIIALEQELASEKKTRSDTASKLETLTTEISVLTNQLDQEKSRSAKYLDDAKTQLEKMTQMEVELTNTKDEDKSRIRQVSEQMKITHDKELELARHGASHRINQVEAEQTASSARIHELEDEVRAVINQHNDALQNKDHEISSLSQVVDALQDQLQQLQESTDRDLDASKVELIQEHEAVLSKLRVQCELEIEEVRDAAKQRETDESMRHEDEVKNLRGEVEKSRNDRDNTSAEVLVLKNEKEEIACLLESERSSSRDIQQKLEESLEKASSELASLKRVFDKDNQDKGENYERSISEMRRQLESTQKMIDEKSKESSAASDKHAMDLKEIRDRHIKDVAILQADINERRDNAFKELQAKYDNLLETWKEGEKSHSTTLEAAKAEGLKLLEDTQKSHHTEMKELEKCLELNSEAKNAKKMSVVAQKHSKAISDMKQEHEKRYEEVQQSHQKALSELQDQVIQSRKALASAENELQMVREAQSNTHADEKSKYKLEVEELQNELSHAKSEVATQRAELDRFHQQNLEAEILDLRAALAHDKEIIDELTAAVEEASNVMPDTSEADRLRESISELTKRHAAEISKFQETISVENEKRDKERKQGADVRDRLVRELESVRRDLPALKEELEQHRKDAELARVEMHDAENRLDQALAASQDQEAHLRDANAKIDLLQTELKKARKRSATPKGHARKDSSHDQEYEALQTMVDKERELNNKLKKQLEDAHAAADRHATRAREKDAALKVTTAELTELRTKRMDGCDFTSSPTPTKTLRTSRWPSNDYQSNEGSDLNGEVLGSHIEGTIAGIQEQIRQIEGVHVDMLDDQKRSVRSYRSVVRADRFVVR